MTVFHFHAYDRSLDGGPPKPTTLVHFHKTDLKSILVVPLTILDWQLRLHHLQQRAASGIARPSVLSGHLLALVSASHEIAWHEWDEHGALAGHVPGQARPSLRTPLHAAVYHSDNDVNHWMTCVEWCGSPPKPSPTATMSFLHTLCPMLASMQVSLHMPVPLCPCYTWAYQYICMKASEPEWSNQDKWIHLATRRISGSYLTRYMPQNDSYSTKIKVSYI